MNYYFFLYREGYANRLNIPRFRNDSTHKPDMELYAASVRDGAWHFYRPESIVDQNFWYVDANAENRNDLFFICLPDEFELQKKSERLIYLNDYTKTAPDYRCNILIKNDVGGFTSYQSEYPFSMVGRRGGLISSIDTLKNDSGKMNALFIRNVFHEPIQDNYPATILETANNTVLDEIELRTNTSNFIDLAPFRGHNGLYVMAKGFLGVPVYFSEGPSGALSMEHTHPPHESVRGPSMPALVKRYRDEIAKKIR